MSSGTVDVELILTVITGVAWTIVYVAAIWVGFRQKTFAMPFAALALNFAWELTYAALDTRTAVSHPNTVAVVWALVEIAWALADVLIVYTFFRFGRAEFPFLTRQMFMIWAVVAFGASCAVQWLFIAEFGARDAVRYSAFLQTLLMSGLFIAMFFARRGLRGQTLTIAIAKWMGTLAATLLYGVVEWSPFILGLGVLCCVFDVVYIGLVVLAERSQSSPAPAAPPDAGHLDPHLSGQAQP